MAYPAGQTAVTLPREHEKRIASDVTEEYHDPLDDWSSRDTLLSLVPFIVSIAFKDVSLVTALNFGIAYSAFLLILRMVAYDSRQKTVWPILDLTTLVLFAVVRGLMRNYMVPLVRWWPVILPCTFAVVALISVAWRRPFTAHYARYPKFDRGGKGVWHGDASYRRTNDMATLGWASAWSIALLLSLIPILLEKWLGWNALNAIFNYIVPLALMAAALVAQQVLGSWYRSTTARSVPQVAQTASYPAGAGETSPVQYTSGV